MQARMQRVKDHIDEYFCQPLRLDQLAAVANVSVAKLKRDYKAGRTNDRTV